MMKVLCPGCNARYNLDTSKIPAVPEKGVTVTCPKCKHKFPLIIKPQDIKADTSKDTSKEKPDVIIPCPDCGHVNISSPKCLSCGKVFTKEELAKLKISIGG
jgi:predicted Zn finger-like uncharacterized protein